MGNEIKYYQLTHPQKAIWYTEKMYSGTSIGNIAANLRLMGKVDYTLLEKAINVFIEKNDAARLRIVEVDGEPRQYVSEYIYHKFDFYDFSGKEITELYKWDEEQTKIPLKIIDTDLFYFAIIKVSENEGGFFVKFHHLISDAWTMSLLGNQVIEYYSALKNGKEPHEEEKPSYTEYILSEEKYKKSKRFQKDKEYWNNKFETWQEITSLKTRKSNDFSTKARRKTLLVPKKLTTKIHEYCSEKGVSEFFIFFAALSMYISRVKAKEDIILSTTLLNRSNVTEKETAGMFASIAVPMRVHIKDDMNLNSFVEVISKETLSIFRHQKYPFDLLLKEVREQHKISGSLFDIVLTYQNSKFNKAEHTEEYITRWHFNGHQIESMIMNISDRDDEGHLIINYDYLIHLFHATEIEFIHQHIINLLWHALDNPEKKISKLEMLSEKEKHKILHEFNDTNIDYSKDKVLQQLFSEQVEKTSDNIKLYILDKNNNLLPIGIAGELCIGGDETLGGYFNKPGLHQEKFLTNPFIPEGKIYKTGELARWYPKGEIEYFGKIDLKKSSESSSKKKETQVRIAATFTSEPLGDYIKWWGSKFGHNLKIEFAGYNQVFQELIDVNSKLSENKDGFNVVLIRFEDFFRNDNGNDESKILKLEKAFKDLKEAISSLDNATPLIVPIFPMSSHLNLSEVVQKKVNELNAGFEEILSKYKNVYTINLNDIQDLYSIEEVFDSLKDNEGHMPFTDEFYAAVGTEIARKICAIKKQHFKVIVLDCDDTLWKGICGEQGALGVKIEGVYKELQKFMLQKYNEGMLLAVCSKNNEKDVFEVFDKNTEMILKRKHILNWKISWQEKSQSIKDIAKELNLGLDSFIFLDDSPIECSKMVENCPELLTLQLPSEENILQFLKHVWAFDRVNVTKEDVLRSSMYKVEQKRQQVSTGLSLDEFIKNLDLKVSMREISDSEIERASQMTQRTNQFNLSTIRRTGQEIAKLMQDNKSKCFIIEASDNFGYYGIVGLLILKEAKDKLFIDTFLLSCRILGRKVEDIVLSGVRKYAEEQEKSLVEATFIPTQKNKPMLEFIERTKWNIVERGKKYTKYSISVNELPKEIEHISFLLNEMFDEGREEIPIVRHEKKLSYKTEESKKVCAYDFELCNAEILEKTIHKEYILPIINFTGKKLMKVQANKKGNIKAGEYQVPTNEIEEKLIKIWEDILRIEVIGIDDDFFELGGDSLHAIQFQVSLLKYNWNLTTQDIYKYRTVRQLSNVIMKTDKNNAENVTEDNREESVVVKDTKAQITSISEKDLEYANILLVGATGYLGAHVLAELLTSTKSNVYCLARSKTNNDAKERLKKTLKFYFGDKYNSVIDKRVFAVSGDITLEYLGLKQNEYIQFQQKIDSVVHAGALVNYYGDYSDFEKINIGGTENVIKFCLKDNKPLLYISTMGVSGQYLVTNKNENKINVFTEDDLYIGQNYFDNPYVRSKYETEILVNNYIKAGVKIAILRVGNLTGRFIDGHFQKNITQNAFYNIMKSIISIGAVSNNILNQAFDFTPVDYCSKAIVKLLMKNESIGRTFHLYNHNRVNVSQIIQLFNDIGIKIKCLEKDEFKQLINKISSDKSGKNNIRGVINDFDEESQLSFNTSVKLDSEITVSYLKQLGFEWTSINAEYIQKIINYMEQVKYIS